jgi:squalene-hopene/tetraprenyl-beta-curcumene cyclase
MKKKLTFTIVLLLMLATCTVYVPNAKADLDPPGSEHVNDLLTDFVDKDYERDLLLEYYRIFKREKLHEQLDSVLASTRSATRLISEIRGNWHRLSPETQNELQWVFRRPVDAGGGWDNNQHLLPKLFTSSSANFVFHWTDGTDGGAVADAPPSADSDGDAVPDFIESFADIFDHVWATEITSSAYGYHQPPSDAAESNENSRNPDDKFDVFVYEVGAYPAYGYTDPEEKGIFHQHGSSYSYIAVDNDYFGFPGTQLGCMQVTAAHEFFHAIQFYYDCGEESWWMETTAVWMEDEVYDDVNDYLQYIPSWFAAPHRSLTSEDGSHEYGNCIFAKFLSENQGKNVIRDIWNEMVSTDGIPAIDNVLRDDYGTDFESVFREFTIANYLNNNNNGDNDFTNDQYEEGDLYDDMHHRDRAIPATLSQENPVEEYASEYIEITPPGEMTISFNGDWQTNFLVRLAKIDGTTIDTETLELNWVKDGSLKVLGIYDRIALIITRLDDWFGDGTYTVTLTGLFDFYVEATPDKIYYKLGETTETDVTVTNTRGVQTTFWIGVSFKDSTGESSKYNTQITTTPSSATLDHGQSTTFSVTWNIPSDAPVGSYQIAVNCWKNSDFKQSYTDNLEWTSIFYVYKLNIRTPTSSMPAIAGDPSNPNEVLVSVEWIPRLLLLFMTPTFFVEIDHQPATYELIDPWNQLFGIYTLKTAPPTMPSEGLYDLDIAVTFGELADSDNEPEAIKYVTAPPEEPIQKGLAWLRTSQYSDGSWRSNVGVTALSVLAFLNAGFDENDPTVQKAIQYLLSKAHGDGTIYNDYNWATYETSLALIALVATYNSNYQNTINAAKDWLVGSQWDESCIWGSVNKDNWYYGGFGYGSHTRPDMSNTQFAVLALDAAGLPKDNALWAKLQVFLHRCQKVNFPITLDIEGIPYTVQPWNYAGTSGGYDGGFLYVPGSNAYLGGAPSMGAMTGAGIWGLLLSGVPKTDQRVTEAINWVANHYTWDTNPNSAGYRRYYYYLSMAKALTMYGEKTIGGHDWYQELYNKITSEMITVGTDQAYWSPSQEDFVPELPTAYAILTMQTRAAAPPVQRLSYLTFILRSNCLLRILDSEGNLVGYNYMTGLGENNIPTAIYSGPFSEPQYIVIINPEPGTYKLELIGISEGPYELAIQGNYGEEVTDTFEYMGEIKPAELHGSDLTVTAVVGPLDIYANPPEFEEIIDNIPPTTALEIGEPKYVDPMDNIYVTSATPFTLTAEDNPGGMGVASIFYRIYNSTYDTGWLEYSAPFYLTGLPDSEYSIDYYSTDNIGNTEPTNTATVILDNTPPSTTLTIGEPKYISDTTYVTPDTPFTLEATDTGSGIYSTAYRIYDATYDSGWQTYTAPFYLTSLTDGTYTIEYNSTDNVQNTETTHTINVTLFSWNYIYQDTYGRGTTLKINLAHKFFQFITPKKDYGIRKATRMKQCGRAIIIEHCDKQLRLITVAVDTKLDFCAAIAWDLQTRKCYLLIDKAGIEK